MWSNVGVTFALTITLRMRVECLCTYRGGLLQFPAHNLVCVCVCVRVVENYSESDGPLASIYLFISLIKFIGVALVNNI